MDGYSETSRSRALSYDLPRTAQRAIWARDHNSTTKPAYQSLDGSSRPEGQRVWASQPVNRAGDIGLCSKYFATA